MRQTLLGFIRKELTQSLRDPRMRGMLIFMPMMQLMLFGYAISTEIRNVRLIVHSKPNDAILSNIANASLASGWFLKAHTTESNPFEQIQSGEADAVLVSPPGGFTTNLERGNAKLQLLVNAVNVNKAVAIEAYLKAITARSVASHLKQSPPGPAIQIEQRVLFNPDLETSVFMIPGVMCMVMLVTTMVLANMAITREKELGTFEMLISAPVSKSEIIFGKTIPYIVLGMVNFPLILAMAVFVFKVPMRGSLLALAIAALAFVCTSVAIGTLISTFCRNQQQATLAGFLFMFPMIMFSGLMFPIENMPVYLQWLSTIDPLTHFIGLLRNIMLKGGGTEYITYHVSALLLLAIFSMSYSLKRFHTTI